MRGGGHTDKSSVMDRKVELGEMYRRCLTEFQMAKKTIKDIEQWDKQAKVDKMLQYANKMAQNEKYLEF